MSEVGVGGQYCRNESLTWGPDAVSRQALSEEPCLGGPTHWKELGAES